MKKLRTYAPRMRRPIALLLAAAILIFACGCDLISSPKMVVARCFTAIREGNMEQVVECLTPTAQKRYQTITSITDGVLGIDTTSLLSGLLGSASDLLLDDFEYKISDVRRSDSTHAKVDVDIIRDEKTVHTISVSCVKIEGRWYIEL